MFIVAYYLVYIWLGLMANNCIFTFYLYVIGISNCQNSCFIVLFFHKNMGLNHDCAIICDIEIYN